MLPISDLQQKASNQSIHCLGTSYIFSEKAKLYKRLIRFITVLGIIVPMSLGAVAGSYGAKSSALIWCLIIAAPVSVVQLALSAVSLVYKWDDTLSYSLESQTDNKLLSDEYDALVANTTLSLSDMNNAFNLIKVKDQARETQDNKITFSSKEERRGFRYAHWIKRRACVTCNIIPPSMAPSTCTSCGNF